MPVDFLVLASSSAGGNRSLLLLLIILAVVLIIAGGVIAVFTWVRQHRGTNSYYSSAPAESERR